MKQHRLLMVLLVLFSAAASAAIPDAQVLLVDQARVEQDTATLKRLRTEAEARTDLKPEQTRESLELVVSEILTALPDAVAAVATARKADLVVQESAWPADTERPEDVTDAVIAELDQRLGTLQLVVP